MLYSIYLCSTFCLICVGIYFVSYCGSFLVRRNQYKLLQVDDDKEKGVSVGTKSVSEQLDEEVGTHLIC